MHCFLVVFFMCFLIDVHILIMFNECIPHMICFRNFYHTFFKNIFVLPLRGTVHRLITKVSLKHKGNLGC